MKQKKKGKKSLWLEGCGRTLEKLLNGNNWNRVFRWVCNDSLVQSVTFVINNTLHAFSDGAAA
jgi:hypothetical protein